MTINRGCSHVRASHVVTCVMSRLAYDNSMALPPWLPWKNRASWVASVRREGPTLLPIANGLPLGDCLCQSCTFWHASPVTRVRGVCDAVFKYLSGGISLRSGTGGDGTPALL